MKIEGGKQNNCIKNVITGWYVCCVVLTKANGFISPYFSDSFTDQFPKKGDSTYQFCTEIRFFVKNNVLIADTSPQQTKTLVHRCPLYGVPMSFVLTCMISFIFFLLVAINWP